MNYKKIQKYVQGNYEAHQKDKYVIYKWKYIGFNYDDKRYYVITDGAVVYFIPESEFVLDLDILPRCDESFSKKLKETLDTASETGEQCIFKDRLYDKEHGRDVDLYWNSENGKKSYVNREYVNSFKGKNIMKNIFSNRSYFGFDSRYKFMYLYEYDGSKATPIGIICPIIPWNLEKKTT